MNHKKQAIVFLGVNGTLSAAVIQGITRQQSTGVDLIGFDRQATTGLPVDTYSACDLASPQAIQAAVDKIPYGEYEDIRLLICAGTMSSPTLSSEVFDQEAFYRGTQINLTGPAHFATVLAMRCMQIGAKARIVAIGSTAANIGSADIAYSMAKAGLDGLIRSLSKYGAEKGVTAMGVHTGIFRSSMEAAVSDERKAKTIAATHVKRVASLEEITSFVTYYLLKAPDFATGMCVDINGGQHT